MISTVKKIFLMLTLRERRRFYLLAVAIVIMAFTEVVGIGSLNPFLSVAMDPAAVEGSTLLSFLHDRFDFSTPTQFIAFLGFGVVFLIILRNATAAIVKYMELRFGQMRDYSLSTRLLTKYLSHPYVFFLNQNTSELSQNVLSEIQILVNQCLIPCLELIARVVVAISIVALLIAVNPLIAGLTATILGTAYTTVYFIVRRLLHRLGKKRLEKNRLRYKIVSEALGGVKDVKLLGKEQVFLTEYRRPAREMARSHAAIEVIGSMPKFMLETLAFSAVVLLISVLSFSGDLNQAIPLVGVYSVAGYRLMPTMERIFRNVAKIRGTQAVVDKLYEFLREPNRITLPDTSLIGEPLRFAERIELDGVRFRYPSAESDVIRGSSMVITKNSIVGFVGPTGCGKTTLVDIILGLLSPTAGRILVDGVEVGAGNVKRWQGNLGYVPQHIYLADDTIARNIAFGVPEHDIDIDRVSDAARIANLRTFIEEELPDGYDTLVGERGVRLSGGQRQRIGIARALYNDPAVLIMDEATSALDGITEQVIMDAIDTLAGTKTIVLIAHRLTTLRDADCIFMMDRGEIVARGSYQELLSTNATFRKMNKT